MKHIIIILFAFSLLITFSCNKNSNSNIKYSSVNKKVILPSNLKELSEDTTVSQPLVDSIVSNLVSGQLITSGTLEIDIDNDSINDIGFEIIDLNYYNQDTLPDILDSLAVRAKPTTVQLIDNSNHNYPDALQYGDEVNDAHNFTAEISVLGTFLGIGNFNIAEERYLGFRKKVEKDSYNYGWIKLRCSTNNDTLKVIDFGYNAILDKSIQAGEK